MSESKSVPLVIIPSYNSGQFLRELLERLGKVHPLADSLIVDDGSTDDTEVQSLKYQVNIVKHSENRGKGLALVSGFQFAFQNGYKAVITMDADLQHPPEYIPKLIKAAEGGRYDMVIGSRRLQLRKMPFLRRLTNYLTSVIVTTLTKTYIPDSQSGFRYISLEVIKNIQLTEPGYQLETEIIIKAARSGYKIGHIPIPAIYNDAPSSIKKFRDTIRFIRLTLRSLYF